MNKSAEETVREKKLVRLYMELTGASESTARNVFMYVCCQKPEKASNGENGTATAVWEPVQRNVRNAEGSNWLRAATPVAAGV
jgi:hypothetical protein